MWLETFQMRTRPAKPGCYVLLYADRADNGNNVAANCAIVRESDSLLAKVMATSKIEHKDLLDEARRKLGIKK